MPIQNCNILVNYENKSILIEAGNKAISPLLFDSILDVSANTIRWKKDVKYLKIGKKEGKWSSFTNDMIVIHGKSKCTN